MSVRVLVDRRRHIRLIELSGTIGRQDLESLGHLYSDRDFYDFRAKEIVVFLADASLAAIDVEDLGMLADSYIEALRDREDRTQVESAWIMGDNVRNEARMWWEFTRDPALMRPQRHLVDSLESALEALQLPLDWADELRAETGLVLFVEGRGSGG